MRFNSYLERRRNRRQTINNAFQVMLDTNLSRLTKTLLHEMEPEGLYKLEFDTYDGSGRGFYEAVDKDVKTDRFAGRVAARYFNETHFNRGEAGETLQTQKSIIVKGSVESKNIEFNSSEPWVPADQTVPEYISVVSTAMDEAIKFVRAERETAQGNANNSQGE